MVLSSFRDSGQLGRQNQTWQMGSSYRFLFRTIRLGIFQNCVVLEMVRMYSFHANLSLFYFVYFKYGSSSKSCQCLISWVQVRSVRIRVRIRLPCFRCPLGYGLHSSDQFNQFRLVLLDLDRIIRNNLLFGTHRYGVIISRSHYLLKLLFGP